MYSPCAICGCRWWTIYGGCAHIGGTGYTKTPSYANLNIPAELQAVAKVASQTQRAEAAYRLAMERLDRQCEYALAHGFTPEQVELFAADNFNPAAGEALRCFQSNQE